MTQSHLNTAILPQPRTDRSARFRFPVLNEWLPATVTFVGFALLVALSISGCGGGSKGDSGGGANPISVTASASSRTIDAGNSINLTATVSNDKTSSGVKWNLSGPGALSNPSAGSVTYTAPPPAPASATATITATSVADASKSAAVTITIPAKPSISTTSLVAGSVGLPYSVQLNATGGIPPYAWTLMAGTLPACITFNSAGVLASSGA